MTEILTNDKKSNMVCRISSGSHNSHLFSLSDVMCIFHREASLSLRIRRLHSTSDERGVSEWEGKVRINGARSMINRPLTPIHFLLTLGALVTQMKMGGQGRCDDDLC